MFAPEAVVEPEPDVVEPEPVVVEPEPEPEEATELAADVDDATDEEIAAEAAEDETVVSAIPPVVAPASAKGRATLLRQPRPLQSPSGRSGSTIGSRRSSSS